MEGSLGGLQVLDLTPQGHLHQRIISVGRDPLLETAQSLYDMPSMQKEETAFSFMVVRSLEQTTDSCKFMILVFFFKFFF